MNVLYNRTERRLRAAWRLVIQFFTSYFGLGVINLVSLFGVVFVLILLGQIPASLLNDGRGLSQALNEKFNQVPFLQVLWQCLIILLILAVYALLARLLDRRSFKDYGFHFDAAWWRDLGFGLILGGVLMALIFGVERILGWATVTGTQVVTKSGASFWPSMVVGLIHFVSVGVSEEIFSRGYQIRNLAEGLNLPRLGRKWALLIAYLVTSSVFGLLHLGNPNSTLFSTVNIILAGLMLGLGLILTGELAISIGLHITWNFFQGYVFGFPVSGSGTQAALIAIYQGGPEVWTGGAFGPEGGLLGVFAMLLGLLLIWAWVRWTRGHTDLRTGLAEYIPPASRRVEGKVVDLAGAPKQGQSQA